MIRNPVGRRVLAGAVVVFAALVASRLVWNW